MAEVLFINDVYIKKYTQINGAVDPNLLYPSIYLAQDKYLNAYLGTNLYETLKDMIANDTLSGDYQTLVDDYCRRMLMWWVVVEAMPSLMYKIDNGSLVQRTSEDVQTISDTVFKDMMNRAKDNAEYYTGLLNDYLCANSNLFPEYNDNVWPQRCPISIKKPSSNYIFSDGNTALSRRSSDRIRYNQIPL